MSESMAQTLLQRSDQLREAAQKTHRGVFLTGPNRIELLADDLPESSFGGEDFLLASLGNCRCASDAKAIRQFDAHARVPSGTDRVALGHETLQIVLQAPAGAKVKVGDLVVITPGHASEPIDPLQFEPVADGVLAALGYSYRFLGGLRQFNRIPAIAPEFVSSQGFGSLFNRVSPQDDTSLISLAHAEPFACNYGTNKHIFTIDEQGEFVYGVPSRAIVTYLSGTARMAMINLTIVASVADADLPKVVYITGSKSKLDEMEKYALIRDLRERGTRVVLVDRKDPAIIEKLTEYGKSDVVWTNYASQETYEQAVSILADGGNLNSYAGAVDPDLLIEMPIAAAPVYDNLEEEVSQNISLMHHNEAPNDPARHRGLAREPKVGFFGFEGKAERLQAYLQNLPEGAHVFVEDELELPASLVRAEKDALLTDVFIAGSGKEAEANYASVELRLARSAAVNFIDGDLTAPIRSRQAHYVTRHQICGKNVPWHMTNTSEPHSDDMVEQANNPVSFDWMVKGVCGLSSVPQMMEKVEAEQPFGSFYSFTELEDLPYVEISSDAFREASEAQPEHVSRALTDAAAELDSNGQCWSRKVEEALYQGYGLPHPLNLT
jgi:threonine dehydrogenase-like Zn-dependent dehydrogenase